MTANYSLIAILYLQIRVINTKSIKIMEKAKTFGLIIALLFITFLLWSNCTRVPKVEYSNIIRTDTVKQQLPTDTINTVEVRWFKQIDTLTKCDTTTVLLIDSAKCLQIAQNYVQQLIYNRELINDSNLKVNLIDTVQFNSLKSGIVRYELKQPILKEQRFGIGGMTDFNGVSVIGAYTTKDYIFFGGGEFFKKRINLGLIRRF